PSKRVRPTKGRRWLHTRKKTARGSRNCSLEIRRALHSTDIFRSFLDAAELFLPTVLRHSAGGEGGSSPLNLFRFCRAGCSGTQARSGVFRRRKGRSETKRRSRIRACYGRPCNNGAQAQRDHRFGI